MERKNENKVKSKTNSEKENREIHLFNVLFKYIGDRYLGEFKTKDSVTIKIDLNELRGYVKKNYTGIKHVLIAMNPILTDTKLEYTNNIKYYAMRYPDLFLRQINNAVDVILNTAKLGNKDISVTIKGADLIHLRNISAKYENSLISVEGIIQSKTNKRTITKIKWYKCKYKNTEGGTPIILIPKEQDVRKEKQIKLTKREAIDYLREILKVIATEILEITPAKEQDFNRYQYGGKLLDDLLEGGTPILDIPLMRDGALKTDMQWLTLEARPETLENNEQSQHIAVLLTNGLTQSMLNTATNPGAIVRITGIVRTIQSENLQNSFFIEATDIEPLENDLLHEPFTPEEEAQFKKLTSQRRIGYDVVSQLIKSVAPKIYGYNDIKFALLLQIVGGSATLKRRNIHILLAGDPGTGKSHLLKRIHELTPKSRYTAGGSSTGVGLTGAVVKDEVTGWSLQAGAIPLANGSICCIDEFDKINSEDIGTLHEAMSDQTITINKSNIHATLIAKTSILAGANPEASVFYDNMSLIKQLPKKFAKSLLDRFDLIFKMKRTTNPNINGKIVEKMLNDENIKAPISDKVLVRYIEYIKKNYKDIKISKKAQQLIEDVFKFITLKAQHDTIEQETNTYFDVNLQFNDLVNIYNLQKINKDLFTNYRFISNISPRYIDNIKRLSTAYAKLKCKHTVTVREVEPILNLVINNIIDLAVDPDTNMVDFGVINTGLTETEREFKKQEILQETQDTDSETEPQTKYPIAKSNVAEEVIHLVKTIREANGTEGAHLFQIGEVLREKYNMNDNEVEGILNHLIKNGEIYQPKPDLYREL